MFVHSVLKVKDGYTLYALKMVYGGFGAFVMVNLAKTFPFYILATHSR